jgi:putative transposase
MKKELFEMKKTKYTEEKIVAAVKQMEGGRATKEVARELGVSDQTLYNWKAKYGGMEVSDVKKLRALEDENRRLKEMVADLSLDKAALTTVIRKKAGACECAARRGAHHDRTPAERTSGLQAAGSDPRELPV